MLTPERARARSGMPACISSTSRSTTSTNATTGRAAFRGSSARIFAAIPGMQARGIDNIRFNTVIKNDNVDQILPLVRRASGTGRRG